MNLSQADDAGNLSTRRVSRRVFLAAAAAAGATFWVEGRSQAGQSGGPGKSPAKPRFVKIAQFSDQGERKGDVMVEKIVKSNDEWRKQLTPEECAVTRRAATERAFTGRYWDNRERGIYECVCCGTTLFRSDTKFDSSTGWPSFWEPIAQENVEVGTDTSLGMVRDEVRCRRCDAHLGHVFDDGPPPTHLRYCMNSASLKFVKA